MVCRLQLCTGMPTEGKGPRRRSAFRPMPQFVLRTPTLAFDVLADWWQDPRATLRTLVDNPAVREALFIASPELVLK